MSRPSEVSVVVAFADFNRFTSQVERLPDIEVARVMDSYYELAGSVIARAGGRVVKFIGDATLAIFPESQADSGVVALVEWKDVADQFMTKQGWDCHLIVKAHFGPVVAGDFGPSGDKRFDVIGKTVNVAARLESNGVAISVEAFRQLSDESRKRFKKHTPPVTYIRQEDPHQRPRRRG